MAFISWLQFFFSFFKELWEVKPLFLYSGNVERGKTQGNKKDLVIPISLILGRTLMPS